MEIPQTPKPVSAETGLFHRASIIVFAPIAPGLLLASNAISQKQYLDALLTMLTTGGISLIIGAVYAGVYWLLNLPCFRGE
jgi:hypothetical protein